VPRVVTLPRISKEDSLQDFNIGVQWFRSKWTPESVQALRSLVGRIRDGQVSPRKASQARAQLKEVRSTLKFLRFLFSALSKDHQAPKALDEIATSIGKVR